MEQLQRDGRFAPPTLASLELVLEAGLELGRGRVFADLWDAQRLECCPHCSQRRIERLQQMNLIQRALPRTLCDCEAPA
jgi:hypothetical protein